MHGDLLKQQLCDYLNIEPTRVSVIPHIAMGGREATGHVDAAAPGVARARRDTDVRILFFGRIWEYKGLEYLIKAQPLVTAQHPDARFVIGGEGEDFERYRKMMTNPETFELHIERVSDEKRERLFADATIVVLPYISATQSGVIPIAFNHSVPVIATDVGALREVIHHERTGLLIPPRDTEALGKAINRLLDHPQLRAELGSNGNLFLQEQCSDQAVGSAHLAAYKQAAQAFSEAQHR
ncbi:MAG TPA: hypothetical protein DDW52_28560 [Planctomycetaceae bacterium]|nr:hypothetical protein [Planctomycetaceae bacterium]